MTDTFTIGTPTLANDLRLAPQPRKILAHLLKGKSISTQESFMVYHIPRLSDCINKLRRAGYRIETVMHEDEVGGQYARYSLAGKVH